MSTPPAVRVTLFLEVLSSWCHWAEPAWDEARERFAGRVEFGWEIAPMAPEAFPTSRADCDWYYRRSGTVVRSPRMLSSAWIREGADYGVPNRVAVAARLATGDPGDGVRRALATAALVEGRDVSSPAIALGIASAASGAAVSLLAERAAGAEVADRIAASAARFAALGVDQRPTFLVESAIGDRTILSGAWRIGPLAAAIEAQLDDVAAYASFHAHHPR